MMSNWCGGKPRALVAGAFSALVLLGALDAAAAGGKPASKLVNVADTRRLGPGLTKWLADVYNDNLVLYGLVVVVVMAAMGGALGFLFDRTTALIGINLGRLDHNE